MNCQGEERTRGGVRAPGGGQTPGPQELVSFDRHVDALVFLRDLIDRYGDVSTYRTRFGPVYLFIHPEHVQAILHDDNYRRASLVKMILGDGLLASDGTWWREQRRLMQRDFQPPSVAPFVPIMVEQTAHAAKAWDAAARTGEPIDVTNEMTRLMLRIAVECMFGEQMSDDVANELCAAVTRVINDLGRISWTIFGSPMQFTPTSSGDFASARKVIDTLCYDLIARRRAMPIERRPRDVLTLLVNAADQGGRMTDVQLRDEMVTLLVGGHETTALAMAWAWKELAEHPEIESALHQEVDAVLAGRAPTLADLPKLPWAKAIFQEAMRLYPPVWYMARVASEAGEIGGHAIPKGACVLVSAYFTQRHRDLWRDPEKFDPRRFLNDSEPLAHRYAYFPFGGGRHQCMGMHFAMLEGPVALAQLASRYRLCPLPGQNIAPVPGITLRQTPSMLAKVELRGQGARTERAISEAAR
jgi:cytochrome P450